MMQLQQDRPARMALNTEAPETGHALLRVAREIGATLMRLRQEKEVLDYAVTRLSPAIGSDSVAILLHDGEKLAVAATAGEADEGDSPLSRVLELVNRLMKEGTHDVQVLSDFDRTAPASGHPLHTLILTPLPGHGAPMGAIVLMHAQARELQQAEREALRLVGQLLAARLREMRLQARLDTAARQLASQGERFDPNSTVDPLNGNAQRQRFVEAIQRAVTEAIHTGGNVSLLIIAIDHFQTIVQSRGQQAGEEALAHIGTDIQGKIRARDTAARYTGEEFWVLLPSTPGIGAVVVGERLRQRIAAMAFPTAGGNWQLTASVGVSCLSTNVTATEQLIVKATQCLDQSRALGGNQVMIDWDDALEMLEEED